ncbi:hypothetical protein [Microbacterium sp.]
MSAGQRHPDAARKAAGAFVDASVGLSLREALGAIRAAQEMQ